VLEINCSGNEMECILLNPTNSMVTNNARFSGKKYDNIKPLLVGPHEKRNKTEYEQKHMYARIRTEKKDGNKGS
jgi:hypothetical protein